METRMINGRDEVVNLTRNESIETLNDYLQEYGCEPLTESELRDWDIRGGETHRQLQEWAKDFASERESERAENKNAWRYEI